MGKHNLGILVYQSCETLLPQKEEKGRGDSRARGGKGKEGRGGAGGGKEREEKREDEEEDFEGEDIYYEESL